MLHQDDLVLLRRMLVPNSALPGIASRPLASVEIPAWAMEQMEGVVDALGNIGHPKRVSPDLLAMLAAEIKRKQRSMATARTQKPARKGKRHELAEV